jgi:transcriptional/translational regulatory protein YebC/TACO1
MGEVGCVSWMFHQKGSITVDKGKAQEDNLMTIALDAGAEVLDYVDRNYAKLELTINTHGHPDHTCGNGFVKRKFNVDNVVNLVEQVFEMNLPELKQKDIKKPPVDG